jgi:hypothetical protein
LRQLRNRAACSDHLAAVGAPGAGSDRTAPGKQAPPLLIAVDEDTALVENAIEKERSGFFDPAQISNVDPPLRPTKW